MNVLGVFDGVSQLTLVYIAITLITLPDIVASIWRFRKHGLIGVPAILIQGVILYAMWILILQLETLFVFFFATVYIGFATLNLSHLLIYNAPLSTTAVNAVLTATIRERSEYISCHDWKHMTIAASYAILALTVVAVLNHLNAKTFYPVFHLAALLMCVALLLAAGNALKGQLKTLYPFRYIDMICFSILQKVKLKKMMNSRNTQHHLIVNTNSDKAQKLIFIIGESARARNMSLYNYARNTCPILCKISEDLTIFENAVSPANITHASLKYILTSANIEATGEEHPQFSLVNIANSAGFETFWLSNQPYMDCTESALISRDAKHQKHFYNGSETRTPDGCMLPTIRSALEQPGNAALFVHLMGSHYRYEYRIEPEFEYYTSEFTYYGHPKYKQRIVDNYDNTIRYSDYVIGEIINMCGSRDESCIVCYVSDHGEVLLDDGKSFGHSLAEPLPQEFEVPYFYWASSNFLEENTPSPLTNSSKRLPEAAHLQFICGDIMRVMGWQFADYENLKSNFDDTNYGERMVVSHNRVLSYDHLKRDYMKRPIT